MLKEIFGTLLIISSFFDAWKYIWNAKAIRKAGVAKGHSRKFLLVAIGNDILKFIYACIILDFFIFVSSIFALGTTIYNFYILYELYPYKNRGLKNFKRPNIWIFLINALIPNQYRPHL